jgi:hypothetical protein
MTLIGAVEFWNVKIGHDDVGGGATGRVPQGREANWPIYAQVWLLAAPFFVIQCVYREQKIPQ